MITGIAHTALLVREYDEAKQFYCGKLGFEVAEDTPLPGGKRWVRLQAPGRQGSEILLSRAVDDHQRAAVGQQAGGRVLFFFHTDAFEADYEKFRASGIEFTEGPWDHAYGKVAVFKDLYGNRIDLIQPREKHGA
jgi:catechol 2,3-dioxygenase-like lactoylglutathione lyase family enzyme